MAEIDDVFKQLDFELAPGQTVRVPRPNFTTEGEYSRWLKSRALSDLAAVRKEAGADVFRDAIQTVTDSFAAGRYDWYGGVWLESLNSPINQVVLLWLCATQIESQQGLLKREFEPAVKRDRTAAANLITDLLFGRSPPTPPRSPERPTGAGE